MVENLRFMMKTRQKELERRQRQRVLFPHHDHRSESQVAAAIPQPAIEQEQQVQGVSAIPPRSEGSFERVVDR